MKSSVMKVVSLIYTIASIVGTLILAFGSDIRLISSTVILLIGGISTAFSACILFAIAAVLENTEANGEMLTRLLKRTESVETSGSKVSKFATETTNIGDTWRCPKCGKTNPISSRVCKDCGYQK